MLSVNRRACRLCRSLCCPRQALANAADVADVADVVDVAEGLTFGAAPPIARPLDSRRQRQVSDGAEDHDSRSNSLRQEID